MDQELELVRIALKERQADAYDRADRLRAKISDDIRRCRETVQVYERAQIGAGKSMAAEYKAKATRASAEGTAAAERLVILDGLLKQYGNRVMDRLGGETAEQVLLRQIGANRYSDPVLRLLAREKLTIEQVMWSREIASIVHFIIRSSNAKTTYFPVATPDDEPRDSMGKRQRYEDGMNHGERMALLHGYVYLPWADGWRAYLPLVFGLCVEGRSIEELRKMYRLDWNTVLTRIRAAVDAYGAARDVFDRTKMKGSRAPLAGAALPLPTASRL